MVKEENIPILGEEIENDLKEDSTEISEELKQEESKLQIVTNEQLIHLKLDNFSLQIQQADRKVQDLISQIQKLIEILRKK